MMTHPASVFVIAFTAINVLACLWLMWWTARSRPADQADAAKTGHVWDGDLEEYNNPLPRWWLGLFIITVLFGAGYLVVFPGLGNFSGMGSWSSVGVYETQMKEQRARFEERVASLRGKTLQQLAADADAMSTARNLFGANCSTCHGSDARGARGFPNLTDRDWLWGGEDQTIYDSIAQGRHGMMPALGAVLGDTGVNEVASYVMSLGGHKAPEDWVAAGKERFATICAACHGADAKGNPALGAPNLTDGTWLHGGDFDTVRATITNGRDSQMPAHATTLGDSKVRLLAAYVLSLSSDDEDEHDEHDNDLAAASRRSPGSAPHVGAH
jgi:cytochrome c oxidase cbb3-type subunit 3